MKNTTKIVTLASFVLNEKIEGFKKYLFKRFKISTTSIFTYLIDNNKEKQLITFRIYLDEGKKIDTNSFFPTTIIVHKRGDCFYTINALNKLIEHEIGGEVGNINYKEYKIDWDKYQGKILTTQDKELIIMDIVRNFSKEPDIYK
jgi:hypothetical protein